MLNRRKVSLGSMGFLSASMLNTGWTAANERSVHVYNWADYIGETTLEDFNRISGIGVVYDTYDTYESAEAKVMQGSTGYDVVLLSSSAIPYFGPAGVLEKLDKSKLPNWKNLDPQVLSILASRDPDNAVGVPYMWGTVGITTNVDRVKQRIPTPPSNILDLIFDPKYTSRIADCGVNVLESPGDVFPLALRYLRLDPDSTDAADYDKVIELFARVRADIRTFDSSNYLNGLPNDELCVSMSWSGDYATAMKRAQEAGRQIQLAYEVPESGSPAWFDVFVIPADSPRKDAAYQFLNFLLEPEVIAKVYGIHELRECQCCFQAVHKVGSAAESGYLSESGDHEPNLGAKGSQSGSKSETDTSMVENQNRRINAELDEGVGGSILGGKQAREAARGKHATQIAQFERPEGI